MRPRCRYIVFIVLAAPLVGGCHNRAPATPPPPPVRVATLQTRPVEQMREWLATLDGATTAEIRPHVSGYIASVDYQEGSVVKTDTLLFTLDKRPFVAALREGARRSGERHGAARNKSRADVARYTPLVAEHAISKEQLDNAHAAVRVGAAQRRGDARRAARSPSSTSSGPTCARPSTAWPASRRRASATWSSSNQVLTVVSTLDPIRSSVEHQRAEYLQFAERLNHVNEPRYANTR